VSMKIESTMMMYCIVYRYLYSAFHSISQIEALSVHFSSRKNVRLRRERDKEKRAERIKEWRGGRRYQNDRPIDAKDLAYAEDADQ